MKLFGILVALLGVVDLHSAHAAGGDSTLASLQLQRARGFSQQFERAKGGGSKARGSVDPDWGAVNRAVSRHLTTQHQRFTREFLGKVYDSDGKIIRGERVVSASRSGSSVHVNPEKLDASAVRPASQRAPASGSVQSRSRRGEYTLDGKDVPKLIEFNAGSKGSEL